MPSRPRVLPLLILRRLACGLLAAAVLLALPGCGKAGRDKARTQIKQSGHAFTADEFVLAATRGDRGLVEAFLRGGMDRNTLDAKGVSPLMAAAVAGQADVLKTLLDENANPNLQNKAGDTALLLAAAAHQPGSVRALVEANADVRGRNQENLTPLLKAANARDKDVVDVLLATSRDQLARDGQLDRALLVAALLGDGPTLGALLDHGANPNFKLENGQTALMFAASFGKADIVETLLTRKADPRLVNKEGASASVLALQQGHPDIARLLDSRTPGTAAPAATAVIAANPGTLPPPTGQPPAAGDAANTPPPLNPRDADSQAKERAWLKQNGVEPTALLNKDTGQDDDRDGFTNDEELAAGTDPNDPNSHPPYYTKLRLRRVEGEAFPVVFDSYTAKTSRVGVTLRGGREDAGRKTDLAVGERVPGLPYKIGGVRVRQGYEKDTGQREDRSELTLLNVETNRKVVLRKGLDANSPDATAVLVFQLDGTELSVRQGQTFALPRDPATRFEVLDLRPTQAVLRLVGSGQTVTVEKE